MPPMLLNLEQMLQYYTIFNYFNVVLLFLYGLQGPNGKFSSHPVGGFYEAWVRWEDVGCIDQNGFQNTEDGHHSFSCQSISLIQILHFSYLLVLQSPIVSAHFLTYISAFQLQPIKYVRITMNVAMICETIIEPPADGDITRDHITCKITYTADGKNCTKYWQLFVTWQSSVTELEQCINI